MGIPRFSQKLPGLSRRGAAFVLQPGAATFTGEGSTGALDMKISILGLLFATDEGQNNGISFYSHWESHFGASAAPQLLEMISSLD